MVPDAIVVSYPLSIKCPQCRKPDKRVKSLTRSDTRLARRLVILENAYYLVSLQEEDSWSDYCEQHSKLLDSLLEKKVLVMKNPTLLSFIKARLTSLYKDGWMAANIYHLRLFDEQLPTTVLVAT